MILNAKFKSRKSLHVHSCQTCQKKVNSTAQNVLLSVYHVNLYSKIGLCLIQIQDSLSQHSFTFYNNMAF